MDEVEMIARQRMSCRCGLCGELLGEDVSVRQCAALIAAHRTESHPAVEAVPDQQRANRRAREESDRRVLAAFDGTWMSVQAVKRACSLADPIVRKVLARLVEEGLVERMKANQDKVLVFRRAA